MSIEEWNQRYQSGEQVFDKPAPVVEKFTRDLDPGTALDLACGPGRHTLYLAAEGWRVTALDGSAVAIELLRKRAAHKNLQIDARVADLEGGEFQIQRQSYDLICDCYYLQRSLFPAIKAGLRPGGRVIAIVHLTDPDKPEGTPKRARTGELRTYFEDWEILHYYEGNPSETCHQRAVAELVARKPIRE